MGLKNLMTDVRREIAGILMPETKTVFTDYMEGFVNLWDLVGGKIQPSDYEAQCKANEGWVYACVATIAESCAMAKLELHVKRGDKTDIITDHIFLTTWQNVNPFMNNFELQELTEMYQLLTGNAYWYLLKNKLGVPVEIWPIPAQYMKIVPNKQDYISGYIYEMPGGGRVAFTPEEIVHFKYANPNNIFYGMSPLLAAAYAVNVEEYMDKYQANTFKNGGMPQALLSSDQVINKAEATRMREEWKQLYAGVDRAGKLAILSKGLKYQTVQMTAQELAYIQGRNMNRDKILAIFRVPKSILGMVEDVNRANAEATEYIFNSRNIYPKLIRKQEKINEQIMPLYKQAPGTILYVEYRNPVPQNRELEIKERDSRLNTGFSTINEEREIQGLENVPWGEVPIMQISMAPLGSAPATPAPGAAPKQKPEAEPDVEAQARTEQTKYFTRSRVWAIYKARFDNETYDMRNIMQRLFKRQMREVMANLDRYYGKGMRKEASDAIIFVMAEWEKAFIETAGPYIDAAYEAGAIHGIRVARLDQTFNLNNPIAQRFLADKKLKFSFETNKTTRSELKAELDEGLVAGETHKQLADRVMKVFDFAEQYRAMRIARTEIADAENHAMLDQWSVSSQVESKEWLHGGGGAQPRPEHVAMNGEVVPMGARFSNGLEYPGDPSQGPGEICNCTCTLLPIVKEQ